MSVETAEWYKREEDWTLKRSIIFNKNLVRLTFIEVDRLLKLMGDLSNTKKVLDLCCGIGRHSFQFARHGFEVTGVDITQPYLDQASEQAKSMGFDIDFVQADMKEYVAPEKYDMVANLCTSFGYFDDIEDDIQVLQNVYDSLVPGGKFVIEILGKEVIAATLKPVEHIEEDGYKVVATTRIIEDWSRLECKRLISKDGIEEEIVAYHRLYSASEMKSYLTNIGFKNIEVYGNFGGAPYDHKAKSMIVISQK